jgi:predicted nucleic acid-binding Zn ribbon protein
MPSKKKKLSNRDARRIRMQQILFVIIAIMIIIVMIVSLFARL